MTYSQPDDDGLEAVGGGAYSHPLHQVWKTLSCEAGLENLILHTRGHYPMGSKRSYNGDSYKFLTFYQDPVMFLLPAIQKFAPSYNKLIRQRCPRLIFVILRS